jgi:hypothetical protein
MFGAPEMASRENTRPQTSATWRSSEDRISVGCCLGFGIYVFLYESVRTGSRICVSPQQFRKLVGWSVKRVRVEVGGREEEAVKKKGDEIRVLFREK